MRWTWSHEPLPGAGHGDRHREAPRLRRAPEEPEHQDDREQQEEPVEHVSAQAGTRRGRGDGLDATGRQLRAERRGRLPGDDGRVRLAVRQVAGRYRVRAAGSVAEVHRLDLVRAYVRRSLDSKPNDLAFKIAAKLADIIVVGI